MGSEMCIRDSSRAPAGTPGSRLQAGAGEQALIHCHAQTSRRNPLHAMEWITDYGLWTMAGEGPRARLGASMQGGRRKGFLSSWRGGLLLDIWGPQLPTIVTILETRLGNRFSVKSV